MNAKKSKLYYHKTTPHQVENIVPEIREITPSETLPVRHEVMWPNKPLDYVKLPHDKNGRHFGLCINGKIISILSLFIKNNEVQFRKFATLTEFQGLGYGTILLKNIIALVKKEGVKKIWCNARIEKSAFYERFLLKPTNTKFHKSGIGYIIMERNFISIKENKNKG